MAVTVDPLLRCPKVGWGSGLNVARGRDVMVCVCIVPCCIVAAVRH